MYKDSSLRSAGPRSLTWVLHTSTFSPNTSATPSHINQHTLAFAGLGPGRLPLGPASI